MLTRPKPRKRRNHYGNRSTCGTGKCLGPAATIAARQSATGTKTDTPIQKVPQSISVVTAEEMALHQPRSVKEA
jgi:outer membrane receptor protein involved in Fe transport